MNIDDFSALREKSEPSQRIKPLQLVFHFCVFAVAPLAKCAGCILVSDLMIPLYLDSILTIMVTATSGVGAGLMCAVLSNGILTIFDYTMLPFMSCHMLTSFLAWGVFYYSSRRKTLYKCIAGGGGNRFSKSIHFCGRGCGARLAMQFWETSFLTCCFLL